MNLHARQLVKRPLTVRSSRIPTSVRTITTSRNAGLICSDTRCRPTCTKRRWILISESSSQHCLITVPAQKADIGSIDPFFLRDSCMCVSCVDTSTRQKNFETSEIPLDLSIRSYDWMSDGSLQVTWDNDVASSPSSHTSTFSAAFLSTASSSSSRQKASHNTWPYVTWQKSSFEADLSFLTMGYKEYMTSPSVLWTAISSLQSHGLIFLTSVPSEEKAVKDIANRIGPLRNSFYGLTWNVRSEPSAKNVAYTSSNLDFHMDLLYMADPPGIQFLHMLKSSTSGGESRFTDAVAAFDRLQDENPELVDNLARFPISYEYHNDGRWMQQTRYFLEGGSVGRSQPQSKPRGQRYEYAKDYEVINWSPPFQGVNLRYDLQSSPSIKEYIRSAARFKESFSSQDAVYETKMEEGSCAIFNNRRILHARRPFTLEGGERWLRGAYVDGDYLRDRYRVLKEEKEKRNSPY